MGVETSQRPGGEVDMRCKWCIYKTYDWGEQYDLCNLFGYGDNGEITENRKGELGCRFNAKTIEKMNREERELIAEHGV